MRREFALPAEDMEWLESCDASYELVSSDAQRVVLHNVAIPAGYNMTSVGMYFRIDPGYPDCQIDMVYFYPELALANGKPIAALSPDTFEGQTWQRWSRHRTPANPWRPGIDNLSTHFELVLEWLKRELTKP